MSPSSPPRVSSPSASRKHKYGYEKKTRPKGRVFFFTAVELGLDEIKEHLPRKPADGDEWHNCLFTGSAARFFVFHKYYPSVISVIPAKAR